MRLRQEDRVDAHVDAVLIRILANGQQLDDVAEVLRVLDVVRRDLRDAFDRDVFELHARVEGKRGEDGCLARRIEAVDVRRRVCLCIALGLRFLEDGVVVGAALRHLRQHVVRRAVDDAEDLRDAVGRQTLLERRDDRDAAADARLEAEVDVLLLGHREHVLAELRDDILVGRHDALAGLHRAQHVLARRVDAAHELHDDIDLRVIEDILNLVRELDTPKLRARLLHIAHEHRLDFNRCADAFRNLRPIHLEHPNDARSDRTGPEQTNLYMFSHPTHLLSLGLTENFEALDAVDHAELVEQGLKVD